jgi:hypothetical protein
VTRNLIDADALERGLSMVGGLTFNAFPEDGYNGPMFVFAAIRLGDHAHVEIQSGRWLTGPSGGTPNVGLAGRICLRWNEWVTLRDHMDLTTQWRIAEVQNPTDGQAHRYVTHAPPDVGEQVIR